MASPLKGVEIPRERLLELEADLIPHNPAAFWGDIFETSGTAYRTPTVVPLDQRITTGCGPAGPDDFAFYCRADEAIYYSPAGFAEHERGIGDFASIVVTAHEWGHHIQWLVGVVPEPGNAFELQADCLAGAYAIEAGQQGLLDPGDVTEAVASSAAAGDPLGLPQDAPGAHGINDDRVISFMRGFLDGVSGCDLPLSSFPDSPTSLPTGPETADPLPGPAPDERRRPELPLTALLPAVLELPQGQPISLDSEGTSSFDDIVDEPSRPGRGERQLARLGLGRKRLSRVRR